VSQHEDRHIMCQHTLAQILRLKDQRKLINTELRQLRKQMKLDGFTIAELNVAQGDLFDGINQVEVA
jgi:uncharacterized protein YcgL (UPF0745 family)